MRPSHSAAALIIGGTGNGSRPSSRTGQRDSTGLERVRSAGDLRPVGRTPRKPFDWFEVSKMTKIEFRHAGGNYGLFFDGQIVVSVQDQAKKLGVKPGWKVEMIDNCAVNSSQDIFNCFQEAKWQWRNCNVWFCTDMRQIKREQAGKRLIEIKAEAERLAKLPFADSQDPKHLEEVKEFLPFKGYIDHREDRAITLEQLKMVLSWAKEHCHRWRDADPPELSKTSRMHLNMDFMNTYHLNHWLIKPATLEKDCSLVELLTNQKQPADWFVIHWWGDRLKDVLTCLKLQISTRELAAGVAYWFGAFACRAHSMQDDVGVNPESTCYYRAMRQAQFKVLLILDAKTDHTGPATPFKRAWCGYEMSMSLGSGENSTILDIATCEGLRPSIITQGLTQAEQSMEVLEAGSGYKTKAEREKGFSLEIINLALGMQLQSAQTLRPRDKQRILNSIAGVDLDSKSVPNHDSYNRYNQRLRAVLALGLWRRVMNVSGEQSEAQQLQQKLAQALKGDDWRSSVSINMAFMSGSDIEEKVLLAAKNLPPHLSHLTFDVKGCDISNETIAELMKAVPKSLESVKLNLSGNPKIDNVGIDTMVSKLPGSVAKMEMGLEGCSVTKELTEHKHSLGELKQYLIDEAEKGVWLNYFNMCPSPTGRMMCSNYRFKAP
jgi:hypothetical protein